MSDALPFSEIVLSTLRQIEANTDQLLDGQQRLERRMDAVEARLGALDARLAALEVRLGDLESAIAALDGRVGLLEIRVGLLETSLDQTRHELLKLRVDVMERMDRFQTTLDNVRDSTAVTLMMDQRVTKKLKETDQDRDDLFEQMMAMERQLMTLSLRIDAIEEQRH